VKRNVERIILLVITSLLLFQCTSCDSDKEPNLSAEGITMNVPAGWLIGEYDGPESPYHHVDPEGHYCFKPGGYRFPFICIYTTEDEYDVTDLPLEKFAEAELFGEAVYKKQVTVAGHDALEILERCDYKGKEVMMISLFIRRDKKITWAAFASLTNQFEQEDERLFRSCIKSLVIEE